MTVKPEMSAFEITDRLVQAIARRHFDLIVCNFANGDMVGHTGIFAAAVQAAEALDICIGRIVAALAAVQGQCLITADHGNLVQTGGKRSTAYLPYHAAGALGLRRPPEHRAGRGRHPGRCRATLLTLMDLPLPAEMTGHSLLGPLIPANPGARERGGEPHCACPAPCQPRHRCRCRCRG